MKKLLVGMMLVAGGFAAAYSANKADISETPEPWPKPLAQMPEVKIDPPAPRVDGPVYEVEFEPDVIVAYRTM